MTRWQDINPKDAVDIDCRTRPDLDPPVNEIGEVCPWPWEPQQLAGAPLGQYHCGYCGGMNVAGMEHLDWRNMPDCMSGPPPDGNDGRACSEEPHNCDWVEAPSTLVHPFTD
jgi:hypothetical protein